MLKAEAQDCSAVHLVAFSCIDFYIMAFTEAASAKHASHATRLAVHAASGLAWSVGHTDAARLLRAAEGTIRAAIAQLQAAQRPAATFPGWSTVGAEVPHKPKRKRQRKRKGRGLGEAVVVHTGELQSTPMAVDEQPAVGAPAEEPLQPSARAREKSEEQLDVTVQQLASSSAPRSQRAGMVAEATAAWEAAAATVSQRSGAPGEAAARYEAALASEAKARTERDQHAKYTSEWREAQQVVEALQQHIVAEFKGRPAGQGKGRSGLPENSGKALKECGGCIRIASWP